jgi:hypothetical protein
VWNQLYSFESRIQIDSLEVLKSSVFKQQTIRLSRMCAVSGPHGSGKTLLLRAIEAAFGYTSYSDVLPRIRHDERQIILWFDDVVVDGVLAVTVKIGNDRISRTIDIGTNGGEMRSKAWPREDSPSGEPILGDSWWPEYIGPVLALDNIAVMLNSSLPSRADSIQELPSVALSSSDRKGLRSILGRNYESVTIYDVNIGAEAEYLVPFVVVTEGGRQRNSLALSSAELWVHYLYWFMRKAADGMTLLIDEPESHISNRGHRPLIDEIARYCLQKGFQAVIATHSAGILSRFPIDSVLLCSGPPGGVTVASIASMAQLWDAVGIETPVRAVALVEDVVARTVLSAALAERDISLLREIEIVDAHGKDNVLAGVRIMRDSRRVPVIGVLDADQRPESSEVDSIFFLPGSYSPERELLALGPEMLAAWAELLGRPVEVVEVAVGDIVHLDHQYLIPELARRLGHAVELIQQTLILLWLKREEISAEAALLVQQIRNLLDSA